VETPDAALQANLDTSIVVSRGSIGHLTGARRVERAREQVSALWVHGPWQIARDLPGYAA
jgi:hypothetical protein